MKYHKIKMINCDRRVNAGNGIRWSGTKANKMKKATTP